MKLIKHLAAISFAAFLATACQPAANTSNNSTALNANANANTTKAASAAPTKEELMALERSAYEAWKTRDAKFWDPFLTANFVGLGPTGKLDKAAAIKDFSSGDCDVKSFSISDDQMTPLGNDAALMTYKVSIDATCGGQKIPANNWAAGVYVREGDKWKGAFHAESPISDPNAKPMAPAPPPAKPATSTVAPAATSTSDAATEALMALEKKAWDDWKNRNAAGLEAFASSNLIAFTGKGRQDKAGAIKTWMEDGCEVKSASLSDPASVSIGPDYRLFTFKATLDAKCGGTKIPSENGVTIYAKEGDTWKALFTMGTPIM
jgi:hypothetical protein